MTTTEEIAYRESARSLDAQARALDELRSRTGILVATATVAGSILGARALDHQAGTMAILALAAVGCVIVLALYVLWPRGGWLWAVGARDALHWSQPRFEVPEIGAPEQATQAFLAVVMEDAWDANRRKLSWLYGAYQVAIVCLGAELLFWALELTGGR